MAMTPEVAPSVDPFEQVLTPKEQEASVTRGVDQIPQPAPQPAPVAKPQTPVAANDDDDDDEEEAKPGAAPVAEGEDPFASFPEVKARDVSKTGAFLRAAGRETLPSIGSLPAMAAGAELGAVAGAPFGPVGSLVGGLAGGIGGGMLGSTAISTAQEWALKKLPDGWAEAIGMDDRQKRLDEEQAPTSSFLGGLVPFAVAMRPGAIPKGVLPENATATQRVLANPVTARVFGGGIMGGMELASELGGEDDVEWKHVAIATGFGVVFNKPTKLGQRIMDVGGKPARRALGREEPHEAVPAAAKVSDEAAPVAASETPLADVAAPVERAPAEPVAEPGPNVTSKDWNETLLGQKPPPTIAEVGDVKVMGPGITEEVYMGSNEQSPIAAQTAQEARRAEKSLIEPPVPEDVNATAQRMHPEIFEQYEQLNRRRDEFRAWVAEHGEADSTTAIKHLADTEAELRELSSHMGAAYRRAAEATGGETIPPEAKKAAAELTGEIRVPPPESNLKNVNLIEHPDLKATPAEIADIRDMLARKASPQEIEASPLVQRAYELGEAYPATDKVPGYGTPEYKANREFNFGGEKVVGYDKAVQKLYDQAKSLAPGGVKNDHKAFIVTGPGGAGKSTIVADPLARRFGAALVDADEAKPIMPEYRSGLGATAVHEESTDLMYGHDGVFGKLAGEGANMVIGKIGHNPESIRKLQSALEAKGYEVNLVNLRVDAEEAFRRRIGRFLRTGRVNSSGYTGDFKRMGGESANAYDIHKAEGKFNETLDLDVNTRPVQVRDGIDSQLARELGFSEGRTGDGQNAGHPEPVAGQAAPAQSPVKIADTVASKLIRAGRPINEAEAAAQIVESYWRARADRFKGAKGTAEEMYLAESPDIVPGKDVRPPPSAQPRVFARTEPAPAITDSPIKNGVADFDPSELIVDAKRFQFKGGGDEHGVTDRLKGVKKWDPIKAGMVLVWQDAAGKKYIVDGHQRSGLAKRIAAEDPSQKPRLNGYLIKEADGITDVEARAVAAAKNIAEGTGTTVDAAKVFRDHPELIKDLPPQSELVRQGRALSNLSDEAFGMVVNEVVPPNYAAIVGRLVPEDSERQSALLRLLSKTEPANATQAESIVRQGIEAGFAKQNKESQGGLFGDADVAESLYSERAKVLDRALKDIKRDKTVFSVLTKEADSIEGAGNKLAGDVNQKRAEADAQALQILQTLANKTGPISDALNAAAKRAKADGKYPEAVRDFVKAIRSQAESGDLARVADGGIRGQERAIPENAAGTRDADELVKELFQRIKRDRNLHAEREADGQMSLLGTERATDAELAQRAADDKLRPTVGQKPMDEGLFGDGVAQQELLQGHRGKIRIRDDGRNTITLMKSANPSTFIHETGHDWLERMAMDSRDAKAPADLKADAQAVFKWLGVSGPDEIKTKHHEKFARGFENYIMEGRAPNAGLAKVFAQFKDWLVKIYETASRLNAPINDEIRGVFDRLIGTENRHTVIAEEAPSRQTIHDIHADEAKYLAPHEADAAADRIAAESGRVVEELPPEIRNEIQAKVEQIEAAEAARTDAAGETANRGAEREPVGTGGPDAGPERAGGGSGERVGEVGTGGTQSEAQGAGAFSAAERAARKSDAGDGLSPEPARQFGPSESPFIDRAGNIRVENLTTSQDVARAIHEAADANEGFIGDRRGVITDGQVLELAEALGMDASKLNERRLGQAFNAEQIVAARKLLIESATELSAVMKKAANGTDEDVMAYAIAKDRHQMIQAQVAGITAEAGRALRAFRSMAGEEGAMATDQFIKQATGKTLFQLRQEAQLGMTLETPEQVSKFMHDASRHSFGRMIQETWINAILSGPATHATNIIGNTILSLQHFGPETALAAAVGRARRAMGREGSTVRLGEIAAALQGAKRGAAGAVEATGQSVKLGTSALLPGETVRTLDVTPHNELAPRWEVDEATTFHQVMENAFAAVQGIKDAIVSSSKLLAAGGVEGAPLIGPQYSHTGAIPDIAIKGVNVLPIGTVIRGPGRALAAADTFFRAANYSAAKNALAYRMAADEGLTGTTFDKRVAELRDNPTPEMMEESRNVATEQTLQTKGGKFVQAMNMLANATVNLPIIGEIPPLKFINPFVNIASQIIKQTIVKRTPLGILSPELRADLLGQNGNVAQDMAQARMLMGTGVAVTMGMLAANGYATGSGPKKPDENAMWRLAGNQAHSIRIGDFWYDTSKLGPLGMLMGIAADMYEVGTKAKEGEYTEAAAKFHHAITQNILDQSFMKGPADLIQAVEDPERYGGRYVRNFFSSFVPYSNALAQATRRTDPYTRETRTLLDAIKAKIPWESQSLMPRRDIWGEPMAQRGAVGGAGVTAIYAAQLSTDPVNVAMVQLGMGPAKVDKKIRGVELTPEQYDDFSRLAGRMSKQRLDTIVRSPDFQTWPAYAKRDVITAVIKQSREAARGMVMAKWPQIIKDATELKLKKFKDD